MEPAGKLRLTRAAMEEPCGPDPEDDPMAVVL
jgi:hypothetical protein